VYDYPHFDGTQACRRPTPAEARAFAGAVGADPEPALALCGSCGFLQECRSYALGHDVYGVWGGTTDEDRAAIRDRENLPEPACIADELDDVVRAVRGADTTSSPTPRMSAAS
jgi:hypothetical protein